MFSADTGEGSIRIDVVDDGSNPGVQRDANWEVLKDGDGDTVARVAFWVDEENAKQDAFSHLGNAEEPKRAALTDLRDIPLLTRSRKEFTPGQRTLLESAQDPSSPVAQALLSPETINQVIKDLSPRANDFDFALGTQSSLLRPDGKPRLNLARLKAYIDGDTYEEKDGQGNVVLEVMAQAPLSLEQGPASDRFELVKRLLNEDENFPAEAKNPWGYGSLDFVKTIFPDQVDGHFRQARQFVANLIDYIDSDLIPTSDGDPGPRPASGSSSGPHPNNTAFIIPTSPPAPTILGVEARVEGGSETSLGGVRGHPFITYAGQGFIFNSASTRVLGWVGLAYPWEREAPWRIGSGGYSVEMQVALGGEAEGTRGIKVQADNANDPEGYFLGGWLAQESGYRNEFSAEKLEPYGYVLFPRGYHPGAFDLGNGYFGSSTNRNPSPSNVTFTDLSSQINVLRLVFSSGSKRYIIQDLRVLNQFPRVNQTYRNGNAGGFVKLGDAAYTFLDWHFLGDPRLNFLADGWTTKQTVFPTNSRDKGNAGVRPSGGGTVYPGTDDAEADPIQGLNPATDKWWAGDSSDVANHFPRSTQGFRPAHLARRTLHFSGSPRAKRWKAIPNLDSSTPASRGRLSRSTTIRTASAHHMTPPIGGSWTTSTLALPSPASLVNAASRRLVGWST